LKRLKQQMWIYYQTRFREKKKYRKMMKSVILAFKQIANVTITFHAKDNAAV
jgi:hypothetical protein